jgi:hypothetical protein
MFLAVTVLPLVKAVREDRRVLKDLERQYCSDVASSKSPIGSMRLPSTRKLLSQLIVTLNSSFPDYDFRYSTERLSRPVE